MHIAMIRLSSVPQRAALSTEGTLVTSVEEQACVRLRDTVKKRRCLSSAHISAERHYERLAHQLEAATTYAGSEK